MTPLLVASSVATTLAVVCGAAALYAATKSRKLPQIAGTIAGLYAVVLALLVMFRMVTGFPYDTNLTEDSMEDAAVTVLRVLGSWRSVLLFAFCAAIVIAIRLAVARTSQAIGSRVRPLLLSLLTVITSAVVVAAGLPHRQLIHEGTARLISPTFARGDFTTRSSDTIFIVQLESVNALAVNGLLDHSRDWMPNMRAVAQRGVFFPFFVAASPTTDRGEETILCGAARNTGHALAYRPKDITRPCLPELLRRAGYRSVFLCDFPSGRFTNSEDFMKHVGFDDVLFAPQFLPAGYRETLWGTVPDDFYHGAFAWLRAKYPRPQKLFVYLAMSGQHYPFRDYGIDHATLPFPKPSSFQERYLDAWTVQDRGLPTLIAEYDAYTGGEAHLFIGGDHSHPVMTPYMGWGATADNFLTTLLYVPPRARAAEFGQGRVVHEMYGQMNLLATLFDVLDGHPYEGSFASVMRRNAAPAERCAMFTQPFAGGFVSVVRGTKHYLYSFRDHTLTLFDIAADPLEPKPVRVAQDIPWESFQAQFDCRR